MKMEPAHVQKTHSVNNANLPKLLVRPKRHLVPTRVSAKIMANAIAMTVSTARTASSQKPMLAHWEVLLMWNSRNSLLLSKLKKIGTPKTFWKF